MPPCACITKTIATFDDLCSRHKSSYLNYEKTIPADSPGFLRASEWVHYRLQAENEHPAFYTELDRQALQPEPERNGYIDQMKAGLTAAVLAMDHLLGPNWFRANPDDVAAMRACLDGLDAHQIMASIGVSPPTKRVLNFITQRVKLDEYLGNGITDICGCEDVIKDGYDLCPFHRQHYFAYRQGAKPATKLGVQQWAQKRRCIVSVWETKGAVG